MRELGQIDPAVLDEWIDTAARSSRTVPRRFRGPKSIVVVLAEQLG
jgi:hypothetical protein